jgi:hypothetical protein
MRKGSEFTANIPHIIAIGVLIVALIEVLIISGVIRCSDLGKQYCDFHYMIVGYPRVLIITDGNGAGIGDPTAMKRMLERNHRLPVTVLDVDRVALGALNDYDIVIVEHARRIPTRSLHAIRDYVYNNMGKLVWVGDAGVLSGEDDEFCKMAHYTIKATCYDETSAGLEEIGSYRKISEEAEFKICATIEIGPRGSVSEGIKLLVESWHREAGKKKSELEDLYEVDYVCKDVVVNWTNPKDFSSNINPWVRAEYDIMGEDEPQVGLDFSYEVLGVNYISNAYAVEEFSRYYEEVNELQIMLRDANDGFWTCRDKLQDKCPDYAGEPGNILPKMLDAGYEMNEEVASILTDLHTWNSMATEAASPENPELPDYGIVSSIDEAVAELRNSGAAGESGVDTVIANLENKKGTIQSLYSGFSGKSTSDASARSSVFSLISGKVNSMESSKSLLVSYAAQYANAKQASTCVSGEVASNIASEGNLNKNKVESLIVYAQQWRLEERVVAFMKGIPGEEEIKTLEAEATRIDAMLESDANIGHFSNEEIAEYKSQSTKLYARATQMRADITEWERIRTWMEEADSSTAEQVCSSSDQRIVDGFNQAGLATFRAADIKDQSLDPEEDTFTADTRIATLMKADLDHPLMSGYTHSFDLEYVGLDNETHALPFVLVTSKANTYVVAKMKITPGYPGEEGYTDWAGITVYNPRFATHLFGKGTTLYYAFPPEFSPHMINNMVDVMLY